MQLRVMLRTERRTCKFLNGKETMESSWVQMTDERNLPVICRKASKTVR